jgi:hypothetical protein
MSITVRDLVSCTPRINGCTADEPNLRDILISYYLSFFTTNEAERRADQYLYALKNHLNMARRLV